MDIFCWPWLSPTIPTWGMAPHVSQTMGVVACTDIMYEVHGNGTTVYKQSSTARVRSPQEYQQSSYIDQLPHGCVPANVLVLPWGKIHKRGVIPPLTSLQARKAPFWEFLRSLGGEWMWQFLKEGEGDVTWTRDALVKGTLVGVTDGSYDRLKACKVSDAGWVLACTVLH